MRNKLSLTGLLVLFIFSACSNSADKASQQAPLPYLAPPKMMAKEGVTNKKDYTIPNFRFVDQDNKIVTSGTFKNSIYVADFFYTSCTTTCPLLKRQMLHIYKKFKGNDQVKFLSFSIDPFHDSVPVLHDYASKLGVNSNAQWHFVTGNKDSLWDISDYYLAAASKDPSVPGSYIHSGAFILIDKGGHIRGIYDGTKRSGADKVIRDIQVLLNEK